MASAELGGVLNRLELLEQLEDAARSAKSAGAEVLLLPQLATVPYFPRAELRTREYYNLSERGETESLRAYRAAAAHGLWVWGSYYETLAEGLFHCRALFVDPRGDIKGEYRQVHVDRRSGCWEAFYLQPGRHGFHVASTPLGCSGALLGTDALVPEAWRALQHAGSEVVLLGLSEPAEGLQAVRRHALAAAESYGVMVILSNRRGEEFGTTYPGGSVLFTPSAEEVEGSQLDDRLVLFEVDVDALRRRRPRGDVPKPDTGTAQALAQ